MALVDNWEVAHRPDALANLASVCAPVAETIGANMFISKLRGKDSMEKGGKKYYHMINHGFTPSEGDEIATLKNLPWVTGVIFQVAGETSPSQAAKDAISVCRPWD